jgi:dTDP-4-dehydrorhamnose reductase
MIFMKKILVVGASGLLGERVMKLGKGRYNLYGTYNTHKLEGRNFFKLDTSKKGEALRIMNKIKPDLVVDAHAMTNLDYCELHQKEAWKVNVDGTRNIAEAAKKMDTEYAYISTDAVFDGKKSSYSEKDEPDPVNYYGATKLAGELLVGQLDMNCLILRTAVMYGVGGSGKVPFALWLVEKLGQGEQVKAVTDQSNNPTLADSLAETIFRLFEKGESGIFHVTGRDCMSRYDFSRLVAKVFDFDSRYIHPVRTPELNQVARRPARLNMSVKKVEKATGMKMLGAEEGLEILKKQLARK